ncbi:MULTISPECIES: type ISP restriction/modification enzyme [unclassified Stenotrophomonas]|uniref:type ISP restriction/modification enzyme n=1 Tax=unclassified Stenotrophomonas TaxID=196198 RepID=UPI002117724A|nr:MULTISPECIES: type ISP restriction/modification enzyme [unclassified Stenotrophomonas]
MDVAVSRFGDTATSKLANAAVTGQPEDQLRAPFEQLLSDLAHLAGFSAGQVVAVGETSLSDLKIRPDYSVSVSSALIGYIELKAPGKGADPRKFKDKHDREQWAKLSQLPNLIYFDGNSLSLWQSGELQGSIVQFDGDVETSGAGLKSGEGLLSSVSTFLRWKPIPPKTVKELAVVLARLCRLLRDEVLEQIDAKSPAFTALAEDWRKMLFPDATDDRFADGYAQAVSFGLLMARAQGISVISGIDQVAKSLQGTNSLIGTALQLLASGKENQEAVKTSLGTLSRVLEVVDWKKLSKGKSDAWLYFYEDFLEVYDNKLRKQTGSYYTPPEVVDAMVRWTDEALRGDGYDLPLGLASPSVNVVDPAAGTGTYVLGLLRLIAERVREDQGDGAVASAISAALSRINGFELQLGPYAVAQLRLLGEAVELTGSAPTKPFQLFITDTLSNPHDDEGWIPALFKPIAESRRAANKVKRDTPVYVVIGNPPYKEKAKGLGGWIETGDKSRSIDPLLDAWQPPKQWKTGAHSKHLRNLYVYFWRWASWKVWDHGPGDRNGIVCFITMSGFLAGQGFQRMREYLREQCEDIWVVDCSPEGYQPEVTTRIFQGVQQSVCIVLASRSKAPDTLTPARVRFRKLAEGHRSKKYADLAKISLFDDEWTDCPAEGRAPFLPESKGAWASFLPLEKFFNYDATGVMAGRTWVISPDRDSLQLRWKKLTETDPGPEQERLFHPHLSKGKLGDRHTNKKVSKGLAGHEERLISVASDHGVCVKPVRYGFRSFDRQWVIPDARLLNRPNPTLWNSNSDRQIFITALQEVAPKSGPALTISGLIPDLHHYKGSFGGRVMPLWSDAGASVSNIRSRVTSLLSEQYNSEVTPEDVFAYIAAVAASPAFTLKFESDLVTPGLRIPVTADAELFHKAVELGRKVIWLHTFGERMVDASDGRPHSSPRVAADVRPRIPQEGGLASDAALPKQMRYDEAQSRLYLDDSFIEHVSPRVWSYEVDGKHVLPLWFSFRKADRSKPAMGDKRPPSPLDSVVPEFWPAEYTADLIDLLNVLTMLVELEPLQSALLDELCSGLLLDSDVFEGGAVSAPESVEISAEDAKQEELF